MHLLLEVVLYSPVETVLKPWIDRANSEEAKQWLGTNYKNWLVKSPDNLHKLPYLPVNADEKQKKAFSFNDLYDIRINPQTQIELEHIIDFFDNIPPDQIARMRLPRMSVDNVLQAADLWVKQMNAKAMKQPDDPKQVKTVMEFAGGFRMVDLIGTNALQKEGSLMGHCVGGGSYDEFIKRGEGKIYSLRDSNNEPHATVQVMTSQGSAPSTAQIKGRSNQAPTRKYWPMLRDFFTKYGISVDRDHHNIGLLQIYSAGKTITLTQDQFKDMILDPDNEEGQEILNTYAGTSSGGRYRQHNDDISMGMFVALYGTPRMTPAMVDHAFSSMPEHAVQVVEHYGNKLTPEMLVTAFSALSGHREESLGTLYKRLLIITKPDIAIVQQVINTMTGAEEGHGRVRRTHDDATFVTALAQTMPQTYQDMLLSGGSEAIKAELDAKNKRAAGPFFVLVGTEAGKQVEKSLFPEMFEEAFSYMAEDALKRVKKLGYMMDHDEVISAFSGISGHFWSSSNTENDKNLEGLVVYTKPDASMVKELFEDSHNSTYKGKLLIYVRKHVPDSMDQPATEDALIGIDDDAMYIQYLAEEPNPGADLQKALLDKDLSQRGNSERTQWIQHVDPGLFRQVLEMLRPKPVETQKDDYKMVKDKSANARTGQQKQIKVKKQLTPDEITKAQWAHRKKLISKFADYLAPLIREPGASKTSDIDQESPKFKGGQAAFEAMGKRKLFDVAVQYIDRDSLRVRVNSAGKSNWNQTVTFDQAAKEFIEKLSRLHIQDIVRLIDNVGYQRELFKVLINHAPQMVPAVMAAQNKRGSHYRHGLQWENLKDWQGLDKEKTFEALEHVWASKRIPEGYVDDFTLRVFKRFKPSPAKLLDMLDKADSEEATRYVLKKTKTPKLDLLTFVSESFPQLLIMVPLEKLPDAILVQMLKDDWKEAVALMDRDLRGYGNDDSRRKHDRSYFHHPINPQSPDFARYQAAAEAAGKQVEFAKYVKSAELDDNKKTHMTGEYTNRQVNLAAIAPHLNDYSNATLIEFVQHDDKKQVIPFFFKHFDALKLAQLVHLGMFNEGYRSHGETPKFKGVFRKLDQKKLADVVLTLIKYDKDTVRLLQAMKEDGVVISDDVMKAFLLGKNSGDKGQMISDAMNDEMKNFVADNLPHYMDHFGMPTPYVVAKLFDDYGKLDKDGRVNYHFGKTFNRWFKEDGSYSGEYKPNPVAEKMVKAEAMRRKGTAVQITVAMLKNLRTEVKKVQSAAPDDYSGRYFRLTDSPKVNMIMQKKHVDPEDSISSVYGKDED